MHHGIVLLFDEATNNHAIALGREYRSRAADPSFELGHDRHLPHVSLLHLELAGPAIQAAKDRLYDADDVLLGRPLTGSFGSVRGFGVWCWWQTPYTPRLLELHHKAVDLCAPLRDGPLSGPPQAMTPAQARMYDEHGCWFVKDAWNPHLTLQVVRAEWVNLDGGEVFQPWRATSLALARMGQFGSVREVIHRVDL